MIMYGVVLTNKLIKSKFKEELIELIIAIVHLVEYTKYSS